MKKYGDAAMPLVDVLMPSMAPLLAPGRSAEERRVALCLLDDILEFSPAGEQCCLLMCAKLVACQRGCRVMARPLGRQDKEKGLSEPI